MRAPYIAAAAMAVLCLQTPVHAQSGSPDLVISQVYGGGGNTGAPYLNDFVEIFNRGSVPASLSGKSVQYASAAGTGNFSSVTLLNGMLAPGQYYLVQMSGGANGVALPTPDATGTASMSGSAGKVVLVNSTTALACNGGSTACSPAQLALIVDLVGYGTSATSGANFYEGASAAPTLSNTTAALRAVGGCIETNNNGADFTSGAPTPRNSATPLAPCSAAPSCPSTTISAVQGSGATSPLAGTTVGVAGVVTARKYNGFFLQSPDAAADADPATSEGVFVFTSAAPPAAAAIGNSVCVLGAVAEYSPSSDPNQRPVTEITGPVVTLLSTGNPLPAPALLTSADTLVNTLDNLERYEGMRVAVGSLTVVAPTGGDTNEANATGSTNGVFYGVLSGVPRPSREAGIQLPDPLPAGAPLGVPRFDTNPERLRVDSDALTGASAVEVGTGATITGITGVLDYAYRTYTLLPDPAAPIVVSGGATVAGAPVPLDGELTIASFNLERFFDTTNDPATSDAVLTTTAFNNRLNKASLSIRNVLQSPDILGVSEVENLATLQALAAKLNADSAPALPNYQAYLVEGNDPGGIDVGFLVKGSRVTVDSVTQYGKDTLYTPPAGDPATLNDRPPLLLRARATKPGAVTSLPVTVIVNHLRSLNDIDTAADGPRVREKRRAQAEFLANLIQSRQAADPTERIVVLGDFNAFAVNDGYVDLMGTIKGVPTPAANVVLASGDLVEPDLVSLESTLPAADRYSYVYDGNTQSLDHILANPPAMARFVKFAAARVDADFPETDRSNPNIPNRLSDHDPLIAYFTLPNATSLSGQVAITGSGLAYSRTTRQWSGTLTVRNTSTATIAGPIYVVLENLPAGVTLVNQAGTLDGKPYVTVSANPLAAGATATAAIRFTNSGSTAITYTPKAISGTL